MKLQRDSSTRLNLNRCCVNKSGFFLKIRERGWRAPVWHVQGSMVHSQHRGGGNLKKEYTGRS